MLNLPSPKEALGSDHGGCTQTLIKTGIICQHGRKCRREIDVAEGDGEGQTTGAQFAPRRIVFISYASQDSCRSEDRLSRRSKAH